MKKMTGKTDKIWCRWNQCTDLVTCPWLPTNHYRKQTRDRKHFCGASVVVYAVTNAGALKLFSLICFLAVG